MMSKQVSNLIDFKSTSLNEIQDLFSLTQKIKKNFVKGSSGDAEIQSKLRGRTLGLLFFEASTRTSFSFQTASVRLGLQPLVFSASASTSLEKGETFEDTVRNIAALGPEALVIRCDDDLDLPALSEEVGLPMINAGWGRKGHPTQALLDAYTIWENRGSSAGSYKILFVGDIRHSRVFQSHMELAKTLGFQAGVCAPESLLPSTTQGLPVFLNLKAGLEWCDVVMFLRVQNERHSSSMSIEKYNESFGLNEKSAGWLGSKGLILHPGPINYGVEVDEKLMGDPRVKVLEQVANGVHIRQAVLTRSLKAKGVL